MQQTSSLTFLNRPICTANLTFDFYLVRLYNRLLLAASLRSRNSEYFPGQFRDSAILEPETVGRTFLASRKASPPAIEQLLGSCLPSSLAMRFDYIETISKLGLVSA